MDEKKTRKVRYRKGNTIAGGGLVQLIPVADDEVVPEDELVIDEIPILEDEEPIEEKVKEPIEEKVEEPIEEKVEKKAPEDEDDGFEIEEGEPEFEPEADPMQNVDEGLDNPDKDEPEAPELVTPAEYKAELNAYLAADERFRTAIPDAEQVKALQSFLNEKNITTNPEVRSAFTKLSNMVQNVSNFMDPNNGSMDFIRGTTNSDKTEYAKAFNTVINQLGKSMIQNPMMKQIGILATGSDNLNVNYIRKHTDAVFAKNTENNLQRKEQGRIITADIKRVAGICVKHGTSLEQLDDFVTAKKNAIKDIDRQLQTHPGNQQLTEEEKKIADAYDIGIKSYQKKEQKYQKARQFRATHNYKDILADYESQINILKGLKASAETLQDEVNSAAGRMESYNKYKARLDKISEVSLDLEVGSIHEKRQYLAEMRSLEKATQFFEKMEPEVFDKLTGLGKEGVRADRLSEEDQKLADEYAQNKAEIISLCEKKDAVVKLEDFTAFFDAIESGNGDRVALTAALRKNITDQTRIYPNDSAYLDEERRQDERRELQNVLSGYEDQKTQEAFRKLPGQQKALRETQEKIDRMENALRKHISDTFAETKQDVQGAAVSLKWNLYDDEARAKLGEACVKQAEADKKAEEDALTAKVETEKKLQALGKKGEAYSGIKKQIAQYQKLTEKKKTELETLKDVQEAQLIRNSSATKIENKFVMDKQILDNTGCVLDSKPDELIRHQLQNVLDSLGEPKKNDSKSYTEMRKSLTAAIRVMSGIGGESSKESMQSAMENLGKAAANYEKEKKSQWFHFSRFASEQRVTRLEGTANLQSICANSKQVLKRMEPTEVTHRKELGMLSDLNRQGSLSNRGAEAAKKYFSQKTKSVMEDLIPKQPTKTRKAPGLGG